MASREIGVKSLIGSYLMFLERCGPAECVPLPPNISVYPSFGCRAEYSAPVMPAAPGRFSTVNDLPNFAVRLVASTRAMMSVPEPAASGTMMVTLRLG